MKTTKTHDRHKMHRLSLLVAGGLLAAGTAWSADSPAATAAAEKADKAALAALCDRCALVRDSHAEQRKGKGSGVGAVGGAVVGGLLGNQVGGGTGKAVMTVGGAVAGGFAGNEIEKRVKKETVWVTRVSFKDGSSKTYTHGSDPQLRAGDVVTVDGTTLKRR